MIPMVKLAKILPRLLLLVLSMCGLVVAAPLTIAVNDMSPRGIQASDAAIVSERLRSELVRGGTFRVMDRGQMEVVLREQAFQQSGACDQSECAVQIGKILSVDQMVVGTVGKLGALYTLSAQLLDVETGAIALSVNQDFQGPIEDLLSQAVPLIAAKLVAGKQGIDPAAARADLYVTSVPTGAAIELDGVLRPERTPATLQTLLPGVHRLRLSTDSRFGLSEVALVAGELRKVSVDLKPGIGTLKIVSHPPGAQAKLDGKVLAETPFKLSVAAGTHVLELRQTGMVPVRDSFVLRPDAELVRTFVLEPGREVSLTSGFGVFVAARDSLRTRRLQSDSSDQWLPFGVWHLAVEDPRFEPWSANFQVDRSRSGLRLDLVPRGAFADSIRGVRQARTRRVRWAWASAGASLASFAVAGYLHHDALRAADRAEAASRDYDAAVFGQDMAGLRDAHSSAVKHANSALVQAWIADGVGGVLLVTSIVCWSF
jgi:hypothetical protein